MTAPRRIYAIGDVHGYSDKLRAVHDEIAKDLKERPVGTHAILHVGDYVDRGPDSRGVIDFLIDLAASGAPVINLLGNHDRMFRRFLEAPGARDDRLFSGLHWLHARLGGTETLRSYGLDLPDGLEEGAGALLFDRAVAAVPEAHVAFLNGLIDCLHEPPWFFAHAGVDPRVGLAFQDEDDLIWIREPFLKSEKDFGAVVIHGHTPVEAVEDHGNRVAIDTGAGYGGPITCVVAEGASLRILGGAVLRPGDAVD